MTSGEYAEDRAAGDVRVGPLIGHLARALSGERGSMQQAFEAGLRELLPLQAVRLREVPGPLQTHAVPPGEVRGEARGEIVLAVPVSGHGRPAVLEASVGDGRALDACGIAVLDAAALLGALVLEIDRSRPMRHALPEPASSATLIGASSSMDALRERVARVAASNFTVLI